MSPSLRPTSMLLVALGACQPAGDSGASASELAAKLSANEQRLSAIEAKLDGLSTKLDQTVQSLSPLVEAAGRENAKEAEREARRAEREAKRAERDARLAEFRARHEAEGLYGEDTDGAELDGEPSPPSGREIEGAAEGIQCEAPKGDRWECTIDRAFLEHVMASPALLAKQARIVPKVTDGRTAGFKLYGIRSGSLPKLLGFKNGDMIVAINGMELDSMDRAMDVYTKLRRAKSLEIELDRKEVPMTVVLDIVK